MGCCQQKNYIKFESLSFLYDHYAFVDVPQYYADQLFIKHEVTVRFGREYSHPEHPFIVIFCKVSKRDKERFLSALEELERKMILCGYPQYNQFCQGVLGKMGVRSNAAQKKGSDHYDKCATDETEQAC